MTFIFYEKIIKRSKLDAPRVPIRTLPTFYDSIEGFVQLVVELVAFQAKVRKYKIDQLPIRKEVFVSTTKKYSINPKEGVNKFLPSAASLP